MQIRHDELCITKRYIIYLHMYNKGLRFWTCHEPCRRFREDRHGRAQTCVSEHWGFLAKQCAKSSKAEKKTCQKKILFNKNDVYTCLYYIFTVNNLSDMSLVWGEWCKMSSICSSAVRWRVRDEWPEMSAVRWVLWDAWREMNGVW